MLGQGTQTFELRYHRLEVFNRWLLAIALIALVGLGSLAIWTVIDRFAEPDGEVVLQDLTSVWNGTEGIAIDAVYAEDAVLIGADGTKYTGLNAITIAQRSVAGLDFRAEVIGPVVQSGDTVIAPIHLTWTGVDAYVTTILQLDDDGKVVHHQDYGGG
jgi:hypothetical protein